MESDAADVSYFDYLQYLTLIGRGYRLKKKIAVSCKGTVGKELGGR